MSRGSARRSRVFKRCIKRGLLLLVSALFWFYKKRLPIPKSPRRILICNTASLGDLVIATTVLPILKRHYPESELGFLTSSRTPEVLKEHPLVSFLHTIDHWFWNRDKGLFKALFLYCIDYRRVVKEIKQHRYDLAIDLYPHFFLNAIPILWSARIPARAGYSLQGFSNLLTTTPFPQSSKEYIGQNHLNLLKELGIDISKDTPLPFYNYRKQTLKFEPKSYVVVHMGTGYRLKEWNTEKWAQVVQKLMEQGERVLLTGRGVLEQTDCDLVASKSGCLNYCNRLNWGEFANVIQQAKLLISVDSSSVHLASAVQIPCVVLFAGISSISAWKPPYRLCKALMTPVSCSPCLIRNGCSSMSCIQQIQVEEVIFHANRLLKMSFGFS